MERLRQWLEDTGTSQKALADSLGMTQGAISMWIGGKNSPTAEKLVAISQKTGLSIDELLGNKVTAHTAPNRSAA